MSHEEFLSEIYSHLSRIISSDPSLSHLKCHPSKISFPKLKPSISLSIRRFDDSLLTVCIPEDSRVFQLKRSIREQFSNEKKTINWKYIWKRYALTTDDQQELINDQRKIEDYGISNNCQLSFVRRRRSK